MKKGFIFILVLLMFSCAKQEKSIDGEATEKADSMTQEESVGKTETTAKKTAPAAKKVERTFANLIESLKKAGFNEKSSEQPNFKIFTDPKIMNKLKAEAEFTQDIIAATVYFSRKLGSYAEFYEFKSSSDANAARSTILKRLLVFLPKMASPGGFTNEEKAVLRIEGDYSDSYIKQLVVLNGEYMLFYTGRYKKADSLSAAFKKF